MNDAELFKRAATDDAFRRTQLEDLRYYKNVGLGLVWFCVATGAGFSLYGGFSEGKWDLGFGLFVVAGFALSSFAVVSTRLAALQALEKAS